MTTDDLSKIDPSIKKTIQTWLEGNYDSETKTEIRRLLNENPQELTDSFYTRLGFGTGGLRGVVGVGTNRMNRYTIQFATQGLASYLKKEVPNPSKPLSVCIGYDCRLTSREFAEEAARVLIGNEIKVFMFDDLRPTPLTSFACRDLSCDAAIMITASHNPPEYNGYKVYWNDGGQVLPPHDSGIIQEVNAIEQLDQVKVAELDSPLLEYLDAKMDQKYLKLITESQHYPTLNQSKGGSLSIVYSNLHGTSIKLMPEALKLWGFNHVSYVEEQKEPDGHFPTVKYANPEDPEAMQLAVDQMLTNQADIAIACDPDADRVGVAVRHNDQAILLSGNETSCICLYHICEALSRQDILPDNAAFVKTIVTTELFPAIARTYGGACIDVLPGFKYIAEQIRQWELAKNGHSFLFGGEESFGYLLGTNTRDKDGIISACLISEVALWAKQMGKTLVDILHQIYDEHGIYKEGLLSVNYPETQEGRKHMQEAMKSLRAQPPKQFLGVPVVVIEDFESGTRKDLRTGAVEQLTLPKSNILRYWLGDDSKLVIRPSGTEPKIKIYSGVCLTEFDNLEGGISTCTARVQGLLQEMSSLVS
ncbi:MAG: phosphomannomutase [Waddliaceae bacterium]|nr:phosphomannomutase [Waddliaceae bacterium]